MSTPWTRGISILLGVLLLCAFSAAPVAAGQKQDVSIFALGEVGDTSGTFTVSGNAAGSLCSSGTWADAGGKGLHWFTEDTFRVDVLRALTCDGTGNTFTLRLRATITLGVGGTDGRWMVVDSAGFDPAPKGSGDIQMGQGGEVYVGLMMFH